jgi:trk system potassium uptake protein TrkA
VIAHIGHSIYGIPNVVMRNNDPDWRKYHEAFGVQIVSSAGWGAQRIEELLNPAAMPIVFSAGNGEVEIYEFMVPERWDGSTVADLLPASDCVPVALTQAGRSTLPAREARLEAGDILHFAATMEGIDALRARLNAPEGKE